MEQSENRFTLAESRSAMDLMPGKELSYSWALLVILILAIVLILVFYFKKKKTLVSPILAKTEAYQLAITELKQAENYDLQQSAIQASVTLRRYLSLVLSQPSLFETHEEFISSKINLPHISEILEMEIEDFFTKLANIKYDPDVKHKEADIYLLSSARELLEKIHRL